MGEKLGHPPLIFLRGFHVEEPVVDAVVEDAASRNLPSPALPDPTPTRSDLTLPPPIRPRPTLFPPTPRYRTANSGGCCGSRFHMIINYFLIYFFHRAIRAWSSFPVSQNNYLII